MHCICMHSSQLSGLPCVVVHLHQWYASNRLTGVEALQSFHEDRRVGDGVTKSISPHNHFGQKKTYRLCSGKANDYCSILIFVVIEPELGDKCEVQIPNPTDLDVFPAPQSSATAPSTGYAVPLPQMLLQLTSLKCYFPWALERYVDHTLAPSDLP